MPTTADQDSTDIAGADEQIGQEGNAGVSSSTSSGDPFGATDSADILDTPEPAWLSASYDDFKSATTGPNSSTTPGGFADALDDSGAASGTREAIVQYAKQFLGTPYVWGGTSPSGFDCSGLVQYVMKKFGVNLPRISYQQAESGQKVPMKDLQAGDLVAWDENARNPGADHIAIYIGNGYVIEAPHTGSNVKIEKVGTKEQSGMWGVHLNIGK